MALLCFVAYAVALLSGSAGAVRSRDVALDEDSETLLGAPESLICGGTRIRELIAGPDGEKMVRNIEWDETFQVADEYLESQSSEIAKLKDEMKRLQDEILEKQEQEERPPLATEQIAEHVLDALVSGYGSFALAKDTKCLWERPKGSPRSSLALRAAVDGFSASIKQLLTNSKGSVSSGEVRKECERQLQVGVDATNCEELCQRMAEAAQQASDNLQGARGPTSRTADQLRRELDAKEAALRFATAEREACAQTRADIRIFKEQMSALNVDIADKHRLFLEASDALFDLQEILETARKNLAEQENSANTAAEVLAGAGSEAQAAQLKFAIATAKAMEVASAVAVAETQLVASEQQLKKTQDADGILQQLKAAVSETMLKLVLYFEEAVRKPVRNLGFGEKANVDRFFPDKVGAIVSAVDAKSSIKSLASFCSSSTTQSALNAVSKPGVDLNVLCVIGNIPDINMDIDLAVTQRVELLKDLLNGVESWLDPYKGQTNVDEIFVEDGVEKGEPVGLREVISAFGNTKYYKNYLKQWKLKGKFLELYAALAAALQQAQDEQNEAGAKLDAITSQLQAAAQAQTEAKDALASALAANEVAQGQQQQAQQLLQQASDAAENLDQDLKAVQKAVKEAHRRYEAAIAALLKTHSEHTSLVEMLRFLEDE